VPLSSRNGGEAALKWLRSAVILSGGRMVLDYCLSMISTQTHAALGMLKGKPVPTPPSKYGAGFFRIMLWRRDE